MMNYLAHPDGSQGWIPSDSTFPYGAILQEPTVDPITFFLFFVPPGWQEGQRRIFVLLSCSQLPSFRVITLRDNRKTGIRYPGNLLRRKENEKKIVHLCHIMNYRKSENRQHMSRTCMSIRRDIMRHARV